MGASLEPSGILKLIVSGGPTEDFRQSVALLTGQSNLNSKAVNDFYINLLNCKILLFLNGKERKMRSVAH